MSSEEVKVEEPPPPVEIMPAKSEDKLEIEKEEQEAKEKMEDGEKEPILWNIFRPNRVLPGNGRVIWEKRHTVWLDSEKFSTLT